MSGKDNCSLRVMFLAGLANILSGVGLIILHVVFYQLKLSRGIASMLSTTFYGGTSLTSKSFFSWYFS